MVYWLVGWESTTSLQCACQLFRDIVLASLTWETPCSLPAKRVFCRRQISQDAGMLVRDAAALNQQFDSQLTEVGVAACHQDTLQTAVSKWPQTTHFGVILIKKGGGDLVY